MIDKVKSLYDLGFAIHLLKPRSKQPLESGWTTGPRKTWAELKRAYRPGMNVGVRLGEPSRVGKNYLACIDVDVKDPKYRRAAAAALARLLLGTPEGGSVSYPMVHSGAGNGSVHVYCVTAEHFKMITVEKSVETFVDSEGKKHHKWEICVYSDGRQMVLPPSIHPSGKPYEWDTDVVSELPLLSFENVQSKSGTRSDLESRNSASGGKFKPCVVDLVSSSLDEKTYLAIVDGEGVSDRSGALLGVCNKLLKAGFTDQEILSVLTDERNHLGKAAYSHAKTRDRARAAEWVRKYTLEKSKRETLAQHAFDDEIEELGELSDEAAVAQVTALVNVADWSDRIERGGRNGLGAPKNTLKNVITILKGEAGEDVFQRDEFASAELYCKRAPWGGRPGVEVGDIDTVLVKEWLANTYFFEPSDDRINQGISAIAHKNKFHPVRDYLDGLEWDGKPRIDTWLKVYMGAKAAEPYLSAVSRKVLIAMVKRIYEPGCKFDEILILQGNQGVGKSTLLRNLVGDKWFTDATIDVKDKDAVMTMRSIWLIELGELAVMNQADAEQLKQFASRTTDRIRVPYGRRTENFPRQCVFVGTTNRDEYLKDPTGDRRFWPVKVGRCDFKAVKRDRDQLFAEAKFAYNLGEPTYLEDVAMVEGAKREQQARAMSDVWEDRIRDWIEKPKADEDLTPNMDRSRFRLSELFADGGALAGVREGLAEQRRAGDVLRRLGFEVHVVRMGGRSARMWIKSSATHATHTDADA